MCIQYAILLLRVITLDSLAIQTFEIEFTFFLSSYDIHTILLSPCAPRPFAEGIEVLGFRSALMLPHWTPSSR